MNTTSFQGSTYKHSFQTSIHGQSGLKIMDGEDLTYGDRKRIQQLQSEAWWNQQMEEKDRRNKLQKLEKETFDQQTMQINDLRKQLQQEKSQRLRDMEIAYKQENLKQLDQKINMEKLNRTLAQQEKLNHINYITNHDFYTENPDTCQSMLSKNRVLPYHWKGMSQEERQRILDQQQKQKQQKAMQNELEKQQERLFAEQAKAQRLAIVLQQRAKCRGLKDLRKGMDEYNLLKAQEMKKKAYHAYDFTQTYKNQ